MAIDVSFKILKIAGDREAISIGERRYYQNRIYGQMQIFQFVIRRDLVSDLVLRLNLSSRDTKGRELITEPILFFFSVFQMQDKEFLLEKLSSNQNNHFVWSRLPYGCIHRHLNLTLFNSKVKDYLNLYTLIIFISSHFLFPFLSHS